MSQSSPMLCSSPATETRDALAILGRDREAREAVIASLRTWEARNWRDGDDIRSRVTGPIVDALYSGAGVVSRVLESGVRMTLPYTSRIAREFAMGEEPLRHVWEPQTTRLILTLAREATDIAIAGAYCGDQAVLLAHALRNRPGASVHCFELDPVSLQALAQNAQDNGLSNLSINACGLWDSPGFVDLDGASALGAAQEAAEPGPNSHPATTLARYAEAKNLEGFELIVADVEGGELRVLKGGLPLLSAAPGRAPDIIFEVHGRYTDWSRGLGELEIVRLLTSNGYTVVALRDIQGNWNLDDAPLEYVLLETAYLDGPVHGFNLFATKTPQRFGEWGLHRREGVSPKLLRHRLSALHQPGR